MKHYFCGVFIYFSLKDRSTYIDSLNEAHISSFFPWHFIASLPVFRRSSPLLWCTLKNQKQILTATTLLCSTSVWAPTLQPAEGRLPSRDCR